MTLKEAFQSKYEKLLGQEAPAFFQSLTGDAQQAYRTNPSKPQSAMLREELEHAAAIPGVPQAYYGSISGHCPAHQAGYLYSQEPSAMLPVLALDPQPDDCVLDLCAAPGSKATQIASVLGTGEGLLVANEPVPKRAKILAENLERWGSANSIVTEAKPDALAPHFPAYFDKILVDAPCSGEGMLRKHPHAMAEWTAQTPHHCADRQKTILQAALQMLKAGGQLVYSTCTFAPEENEEITSWLLENFPLTLEAVNLPGTRPAQTAWGLGRDLTKARRVWPMDGFGEGHFIAKLTLNEALATPQPSRKKGKKKKQPRSHQGLDPKQQKNWQSFLAAWPLAFELARYQLRVFGQHLWALDPRLPALDALRLHKNGLHLGAFRKNRFEPSFALSLAVKNIDTLPQIELAPSDWQAYVAGETFPHPGHQGFVLLNFNGLIVGLGKQVQGTVKNFYPKGLRFKTETPKHLVF